jgi:hypothetical protein
MKNTVKILGVYVDVDRYYYYLHRAERGPGEWVSYRFHYVVSLPTSCRKDG